MSGDNLRGLEGLDSFFFDIMGIIPGFAAYYTYVIPECFYRESCRFVTTRFRTKPLRNKAIKQQGRQGNMSYVSKARFYINRTISRCLNHRYFGCRCAAAVPKGGGKSRVMALMPNLRMLKDSLERYYLANGVYPADSVTDLDVDVAGCTIAAAGKILCDGYCFNYTGGIPSVPEARITAMIKPENCDLESTSTTFLMWFLDYSSTPNKRTCRSKISGECESLTGFTTK